MVSKKTWWRGAHIRGELGTLFENKPPGSCILLKKGWGGGGGGGLILGGYGTASYSQFI